MAAWDAAQEFSEQLGDEQASGQYEVIINGAQRWHVDSEFAAYDATHAVAGALLAGAESVEVAREEGEQ